MKNQSMTAKKKTSKKAPPQTAPKAAVDKLTLANSAMLTAGEFQRYIVSLETPLDGVSRLSQLAAEGAFITGPWTGEYAGGFAFGESSSKLRDLQIKLEDRFIKKHSKQVSDLEADVSIGLSKEDVDEYQDAMRPACSFTNLIGYQDMENEAAMFQSWIGTLIVSVAADGLALMRGRLAAAEGGAQ